MIAALLVFPAAAQASTTDCLQLVKSKLSMLDLDGDGALRQKELKHHYSKAHHVFKIHEQHESIEEAQDLVSCRTPLPAPTLPAGVRVTLAYGARAAVNILHDHKIYEALDKDHNGVLEGKELDKAPDPHTAERLMLAWPGVPGKSTSRPGTAKSDSDDVGRDCVKILRRAFPMIDADGDRGLQKPELKKTPVHKRCAHLIGANHFVALDTNGDKKLTLNELSGDAPGILLQAEKKDEL